MILTYPSLSLSPAAERVVRESFIELSSLGGNRKQLEFLYDVYMNGARYTDVCTLKGVANIFGLHDNLFLHPWFRFLSGGLDNVTFKEFVWGLGNSCNRGKCLLFDILLPPGYDVLPVDALRREMQALHGRARAKQDEDVLAGASKLIAELDSGGGGGPVTLDEFREITNKYPKVWRDADVLAQRVSSYATSAASVCGAIRASGNTDLLLNRLASNTKPGRIGRYRLKLSLRSGIVSGSSRSASASPEQMWRSTSPASIPGTPDRSRSPGSRPGTPSRFGSPSGSGRMSPFGSPARAGSRHTRRRGSAPEADGSSTYRSMYSAGGDDSPDLGRRRPRSLRPIAGGFESGFRERGSPTSSPGYGVSGSLEMDGGGDVWNEPGGWATPTRLPTTRARGGTSGGMSSAFRDMDSPARAADRGQRGSRRGSV